MYVPLTVAEAAIIDVFPNAPRKHTVGVWGWEWNLDLVYIKVRIRMFQKELKVDVHGDGPSTHATYIIKKEEDLVKALEDIKAFHFQKLSLMLQFIRD